jgi:glutamyl-tRNA reductase
MEEVERLEVWIRTREVVPLIVSLQTQLEQLRTSEMERMRAKFGQLTPQQEEALEALTRGLINKIAHGPIAELRKNAGNPNGIHVLDAIRKAFRLRD